MSHVSSCLLGVSVETGSAGRRGTKDGGGGKQLTAGAAQRDPATGFHWQAMSANTSNTIFKIHFSQCRVTMSNPKLRKDGATVSAFAADFEFDPTSIRRNPATRFHKQ